MPSIMVRFVFITGGVVSSLGKGIAAAAIGALLRGRKLSISMLKLDPYINADPGTMNPYQHGEVFVTADGTETDLDLGHYERFVGISTSRLNNCTAGQIYANVIRREREGGYHGATVQVIPHITDEIKRIIHLAAADSDICLVEIGGTVGDIESLPFLEAIRQISLEQGRQQVLFIHLTLVPKLASSGEIKTKPSQHSVKELRSIGIQPDMLICRSEQALPLDAREKIALFCQVEKQAVISAPDVGFIYSVPSLFQRQQLDDLLLQHFSLDKPPADLSSWKQIIDRAAHPRHQVTIGLVGKYTALEDCYKSLREALIHAGIKCQTKVLVEMIEAEQLSTENVAEKLAAYDAILIPGGFGQRGIEGIIHAIHHIRCMGTPFFGICLGFQVAVIEYARHALGLQDANSTEFNPDTPHPVVALLTHWKQQDQHIKRSKSSPRGGSMRLGSQSCKLLENSLLHKIYGQDTIIERHRHRYEFNMGYQERFAADGHFLFSALSTEQGLVEGIEINNHPWFVACQFHPEFNSSPQHGHPLFIAFIRAALTHQNSQEGTPKNVRSGTAN